MRSASAVHPPLPPPSPHGPPLTLFLIRHGQTAWNTERRFLGRTDIPLDETGHAQAAALAASLGTFDQVWSSPSARAMQTAERLGPPRAHPGLLEMDMGALEGLDGPAFARNYPDLLDGWRTDPSRIVIPGGETLAEVQTRIHGAWQEITAHPAERVAVVTHQLALASLLCTLAGRPLHEFRTYTHLNTAYSVLKVMDGAPVIEAVNQAPHLA